MPDWVAVAVPVVAAVAIGFALLEAGLRWWIRRMGRSYAAETETAAARRRKR